MLQAFPRSFVRIAWLVRIGNNSQNAFHDEVIRIETASEQPTHWSIASPTFLKLDSTWNLSFLLLTSLRDAIAAGTISPEHLQHTKILLSVRHSVLPENLLWTHRSHEVHKVELAPTKSPLNHHNHHNFHNLRFSLMYYWFTSSFHHQVSASQTLTPRAQPQTWSTPFKRQVLNLSQASLTPTGLSFEKNSVHFFIRKV